MPETTETEVENTDTEVAPKPAPKRKPASAPRKSAPRTTAASNGVPPKKPVAASKKTASGAKKKTSEPEAVEPAPDPKPAPGPAMKPGDAVSQAEDTLDELGKRVGGLLVSVGKRLNKAAVIAREELEDLWAEAQSIRRGDTK